MPFVRRALAVLLLVLLPLGLQLLVWPSAPDPGPDGLFTFAQAREIGGEPKGLAIRHVFAQPIAEAVAEKYDDPHGQNRIRDPAWQRYTAHFYRRRWTVPLMIAAIEPVAGYRSLDVAGLVGYALIAPALFLLLRLRFGERLSFGVALLCALSPPLFKWGLSGSDMWGLALEIAALALATLALERGSSRAAALWALCLLVLSVTRDNGIVLLVAAGWVAVRARTRDGSALLATGIGVSLPAFFLFDIPPLREHLAYVISGHNVPADTSWQLIASDYPGTLWSTVITNFGYPLRAPLPLVPLIYFGMAALLVATIFMVVRAPRTPFFELQRGAALGGLIYLLLADGPQGYRLELVLTPVVATALAYHFEGARLRHAWLWCVELLARATPRRLRSG